MNKLRYLPLGAVAALTLAACASLGHPQGGPRDVTPPRYVSSNPAPGSLNFKGDKISIFFDENVQLDDPNSKVAISPAQREMPTLFANGRRLDVTLRDSLLPNTTYTIDLADAVKDLNEGNVLDGFAIDFSTGDSIDTLRISGIVLHARDLEPAQGMLVGVYKSDADSCIHTRRFERIARTNQLGEFTVRNLSPGNYQLFALNDQNRDLFWDRTEDVAFYPSLISPSVEFVEVTDSVGEDSVNVRSEVRYAPDNLLLSWFNEDYKALYLQNYKRDKRNIISLEMAAPSDSLPELTIITLNSDSTVRIPMRDVAMLTHSATNDTLKYWLRDSTVIKADTVIVEARYRRADSLSNIVWGTDTLKFNFRSPKNPYVPKTLQERIDSVAKTFKSDTMVVDTFALMQPVTFLEISLSSSTQELNRPLRFSTVRPVDSISAGALRLEINPDSVWRLVEPQPLIQPADTFSHTNFLIDMKWEPGGSYRLVGDSLAVSDIYGYYIKPLELTFNARKTEEYSTIVFNIVGLPDSAAAVVELLDGRDAPVRTAQVAGGVAKFDYLLPDTYYARLFIDADANGEWTNGDLKLRRQPEDVYYYPKKLSLKKNWDRTESWNLDSHSVELQKPFDIKENRPKLKAGEMPLPSEDEEEDYPGDDFGTGFTDYR